MVRMPYLRTTVVDFSSETCLIIGNVITYDDETSFRTQFDHSGPWIWHSHHFTPPSLWVGPGGQNDEYRISARHDDRFDF